MKNKKKNKAQRQAGRRLCKNIQNGKNRNCGFIVRKKETAYYESDMRMYVSNASGQFSMDQHTDISKLKELKKELSTKPAPAHTVKIEVKATTRTTAPATPTSPVKEKSFWWVLAGAAVGGGLLGIFLGTRKKSA